MKATHMKSTMKKIALGMVICLFVALVMAGCSEGPVNTPVGKRAAGQDITSQVRADKRGDVK
jgi:hypothetical protein